MKKYNSKYAKLTTYTDDIIRDIDFIEVQRRRAAGQLAVKVMKKNVSKKGISKPGAFPGRKTGLLRRKVIMRMLKEDRSVKVGSRDFKAHLLEFGHGDGKERNKRPFIFRSLREAEPEIIRIMSGRYF